MQLAHKHTSFLSIRWWQYLFQIMSFSHLRRRLASKSSMVCGSWSSPAVKCASPAPRSRTLSFCKGCWTPSPPIPPNLSCSLPLPPYAAPLVPTFASATNPTTAIVGRSMKYRRITLQGHTVHLTSKPSPPPPPPAPDPHHCFCYQPPKMLLSAGAAGREE